MTLKECHSIRTAAYARRNEDEIKSNNSYELNKFVNQQLQKESHSKC